MNLVIKSNAYICFVVSLNILKAYCDQYEYALINNLLDNYNIYARPSTDYKNTTDVVFGLSLGQLTHVDEKNQIITTNCWITLKWSDNKLSWNESDYGGIKEIRLPYDKIWKPDIILYNNAEEGKQISTYLIIESSGNVTWLSMNIFKSSCLINIHSFPFDSQNCSLSFASWTYDQSGINLLKNSDTGDTSNYISNGEWTLVSLVAERHLVLYSCCPIPYPNVTYHIVFKRRPLFYIFNMIIPSFLITFVGFLGFLIPADRGEKTGVGVTTLLSMTVFLMVIADSMPPNSDSVPLIASFYFGSMLVISLATAGTVLTLNIHKQGDFKRPLPNIVRKIFFNYIAKILFIKIQIKEKPKTPNKKSFLSHYEHSRANKEENCRFISTSSRNWQLANESRSHHIGLNQLCRIPSRENNFSDMNLNSIASDKRYTRNYDSNANQRSSSPTPCKANSCSHIVYEQKRLSKLVRALNKSLEAAEAKEAMEEYYEEIKVEWSQLAKIVDMIFAFTFIAFTVIIMLLFVYFYVTY